MYGDDYGTEWSSLSAEEVLTRAYALGVAASLGEHYDGELERLESTAESNYVESLVDLAFTEGKTRAANLEAAREDREAVWSELVTEEPELVGGPAQDSVSETPGLPEAISRTHPEGGPPDDGVDRLRLPPFLRRE